MKNGFAVLGLLLASNFTLTCRAEEIPGPRDPLTFKDSGLYCGWNQYFLQADTPFDYFIVPAVMSEGQDISEWNDSLKKARRNGTRVIVDLIPRAKNADGEFYAVHHLSHDAGDSEIEKLAAVVDDFFTQVDSSEICAITLGEEHIFWNGRDRHLNRLYELIKAKHDVPIYQWYSPSSHGSIPGVTGWPNLKSDGWMADEYHLDQPDMERDAWLHGHAETYRSNYLGRRRSAVSALYPPSLRRAMGSLSKVQYPHFLFRLVWATRRVVGLAKASPR